MRHRLATLLLFATASLSAQTPLTPHPIHLADGRTFSLNLPAGFDISVAAQGFHRLRFLTPSPDGRIFATDMHDLSDNNLGRIYIFSGFSTKTGHFSAVHTYLQHLHNPTNIAFYTDPAGQSWLYFSLTDKLVRYKYRAGDLAPEGPPEVLANYPAYGLSYKYGGWHLTRTIAFAPLHGQTLLYVAVGSGCDACNEKEEIRATLSVMNPDGTNAHIVAKGLRNAVALQYIPQIDGGALFATNMGADHLGDNDPEDTFFQLDSNNHPGPTDANYGWPTCYFSHGSPHADTLISNPQPTDHITPKPPAGPPPPQFDCTKVPAAYTTFIPHASPLGFDYFGPDAPAALRNSFLVALHGASWQQLWATSGYRIVRISTATHKPEDFLTGFVNGDKINGRPCGILRIAPNAFLLTDDLNGLIYYIRAKN
jgi:glucose/arabinose dehydrogenase